MSIKNIQVAVSTLALLLGAGAPAARAADEVHVGLEAPLTGPAASYGQDVLNGVMLATKEINAAGGIAGRMLVIDKGDDRGSPKDAANVTQKFADDSAVVAMVGGVTSTATFGAVPVAQRNKLPFVITLASHPDLTKEGNYIFRNSSTQKQEGPALAKLVTTCLQPKRLAVMHLNNDWGLSMTENFLASVNKLGVDVVANESYNPGENIDYAAKLSKIEATKPDVIWFGSQYNDLALILHQVAQMGFSDTALVGSAGDHSTGLIKVAGPDANGLYLHTLFFTQDPNPKVQEFVKKFTAAYGQSPNLFSSQAYDGVHLLAQAIEKGNFQRDAIRDALAKTSYDGVGGTISFDPKTREAVGKHFTPLMVKDGAFVLWTECAKKLGM